MRTLHGDRRFLNVFPSRKAVQREWEKLHEMTNSHQCFKSIPILIGELNRHLKGWANYLSYGYPRGVRLGDRLVRTWLSDPTRRSQGPYLSPTARRGVAHASAKSWGWWVWLARPNRGLCMPEARVFRRAGRGKSASPVRRGESGSRFLGVVRSPTLPVQGYFTQTNHRGSVGFA
jgi:hypothetical protein